MELFLDSYAFLLNKYLNIIHAVLADFIERLRSEGCPSATVLDLCCGKGGDLLKWKIGNIAKIVMTGINVCWLQKFLNNLAL